MDRASDRTSCTPPPGLGGTSTDKGTTNGPGNPAGDQNSGVDLSQPPSFNSKTPGSRCPGVLFVPDAP